MRELQSIFKMGCVCCSLSSFVSIILDALERISLCTVCALLTCCLLFTIISMMVLGIGIGFHYCFVQNSVDAMAKAAKATGVGRRSGGGEHGVPSGVVRSLDRAVRRFGTGKDRARREAEPPLPANGPQPGNLNLSHVQEALQLDPRAVLNENERSRRRDAHPAVPVNNHVPGNLLNLSHIRPVNNPQENLLNLSHIRQNSQLDPSANHTLIDDTFYYANQTVNISAAGPIQNPVIVKRAF